MTDRDRLTSYEFTNSEASTVGCASRWLFKYGLGLTPNTEARPLTIGRTWHSMMEEYWRPVPPLLAGEPPALDRALAVLESAYRAETPTEGLSFDFGDGTPAVTAEDPDKAALGAMLREYAKRWPEPSKRWRRVLHTEIRVAANVVPARNQSATDKAATISRVTRYGSKLDKVIEDHHGQFWLVEHKTTSRPLDLWVAMHRYMPQHFRYIWAYLRSYGVRLQGVIFDVVSTKAPPNAAEWPVVDKATRLSKTVPAGATVETLEDALTLHGFTIDDQPYYSEIADRLRANPPTYSLEFAVRVSDDEIERAGRELYHAGTQIRRWHARVFELRSAILSDPCAESVVSAVRSRTAEEFPRNGSQCYRFNRPCEFMDLCEYRSTEAARLFKIRRVDHAELEDEQENEQGS